MPPAGTCRRRLGLVPAARLRSAALPIDRSLGGRRWRGRTRRDAAARGPLVAAAVVFDHWSEPEARRDLARLNDSKSSARPPATDGRAIWSRGRDRRTRGECRRSIKTDSAAPTSTSGPCLASLRCTRTCTSSAVLAAASAPPHRPIVGVIGHRIHRRRIHHGQDRPRPAHERPGRRRWRAADRHVGYGTKHRSAIQRRRAKIIAGRSIRLHTVRQRSSTTGGSNAAAWWVIRGGRRDRSTRITSNRTHRRESCGFRWTSDSPSACGPAARRHRIVKRSMTVAS